MKTKSISFDIAKKDNLCSILIDCIVQISSRICCYR